jgi:hypothetical protein
MPMLNQQVTSSTVTMPIVGMRNGKHSATVVTPFSTQPAVTSVQKAVVGDTFGVSQQPVETTANSTPSLGLSPAVLEQLFQQNPALQPAQARPAFALTTSLPEARLIKNPATKALNTVLTSVGIGAVVGGLTGLLTPLGFGKNTGLWLAFGGAVGGTLGAGVGLLLGYGVFGRLAEQQQETENKVHLAKTRVLIEQVTPLSVDSTVME